MGLEPMALEEIPAHHAAWALRPVVLCSLQVHLQVAAPLDINLLNGLHLGLDSEHQYINAGLAVALSSTWLQRTGHLEVNYLLQQTTSLPEQFIKGLTTAALQGRAQVVPDQLMGIESPGNLVFYLDGAHSPESMEVCAKWFSLAIKDYHEPMSFSNLVDDYKRASLESVRMDHHETSKKNLTQILLFNCMSVRDSQLLLPRLMNACASHGVQLKKALFVPSISIALPPSETEVDLSWQPTLQRLWENLVHGEKGSDATKPDLFCEESLNDEKSVRSCDDNMVFPSLPLVINWLRDNARKNQSVHFQVLVTGSLHLVGDVLRLVKK
ncbi:unnamed protein product [Ilex paraguariensis]|uniref:Folylpolyglutamate synthase n=1 Tax=Ilex paraguariensis TaxID=185542 RepID=A0ABC8TUV0_9AQUA